MNKKHESTKSQIVKFKADAAGQMGPAGKALTKAKAGDTKVIEHKPFPDMNSKKRWEIANKAPKKNSKRQQQIAAGTRTK